MTATDEIRVALPDVVHPTCATKPPDSRGCSATCWQELVGPRAAMEALYRRLGEALLIADPTRGPEPDVMEEP